MKSAKQRAPVAVNAMHLSDSNEAYTPIDVVEASRRTLGAFDLDPASCKLANKAVKAASFFSQGDEYGDGLEAQWWGRVFCNPPGGKVRGKKSRAKMWWAHGAEEWLTGRVDSMIWIAFKVDFLQTTQVGASGPIPLDFPVCYPSRRLAYLSPDLPGPTPKRPDRKPTARQLADHAATGLCTLESPPHASAIIYLPGRGSAALAVRRFQKAFKSIGEVVFDKRRLPSRAAARMVAA
jgi:hypothetical protein